VQSGTQTLRALYDAARNYDAPYRAALAQVRASDAAVSEARAALLPQVGFQADLQGNRLNARANHPIAVGVSPYGQPILGQTLGRDYAKSQEGINATQALYRPADKIAWDQAKHQLDTAQAQLAAAQEDLIVRLAQAYFDVLAAHDTLRYLRTLKDSVSQQLAMAQRNFEIGNANVTDSREAQARLAMTRAREIAAGNDLRVKQLALEQLVGKTGIQPRPLADSANPPAPDLQNVNAWVARATNAPIVRQARQTLEVAQLEMDKAKTGHQPTLDLQASVGREQDPSGNPMGSIAATTGYNATLTTIGVQLTWPLFAGGAVLARERETLALKDEAQAGLDNALRNSTQAARTAYFNLQSGLDQIKALEAAEEASRTALQANRIGYRIGARTNIDVLNAQSELFDAQRDLARARYDALVGLLRLKQAAGVLMPDDLAQIDRLLAPDSKTP
jgi:outer membrane protein